jgi:hypothetical protein
MTAYYSDWQELPYTCPECAWSGLGKACKQGQMFRELFELCCPNCGEKLGIVLFPTVEESRQNWDKVSEADKRAVETIEFRQRDFANRGLKSPDQLPDLEGDDLILVWDVEHFDGGDLMIKYGERVIWRETGFYECYKRFEAMTALLKQKYGDRLQDLVPTRKSELYLYGDSLSAIDRVRNAREALTRKS